MTVNFPVWQIAFNALQIVLTIAVWWSTRNKVTNDRFTQLENSKIKLELDLKHLKQKLLEQRPACENHQRMEKNDTTIFNRLESLHTDIKNMTGSVSKIEGSLEGIKHTSQLINEFLLNQGGKK